MTKLTSRTIETHVMILTETFLCSSRIVQAADTMFLTRAIVGTHCMIASGSCPSGKASTLSGYDVQKGTLVLGLNAKGRLDTVRIFITITSEITTSRVLIAGLTLVTILTLAVRAVLLLFVRARTKDGMCTVVRTQRGGTCGITPSREALTFRLMSVLVVSMCTYSSKFVAFTLLIFQLLGCTLGERKWQWWW